MKQFKFYALLGLMLSLFIVACTSEEATVDEELLDLENVIINNDQDPTRILVTDKELLETIRSLDIDAGAITKGDFYFPGGATEERFFIGNDISFSQQDLDDLIEAKNGNRQYRTFNLVTGSNRTISVVGFTGGNQALSTKARNALQMAVANFNNLNTSLQLNLSFGTNWQAFDMVVYDNSVNQPGQAGGQAGFPSSNGEPFQFVQIYGLENFNTDINEHVITHEIGHSVGFRHTDWFDRLSCPAANQGNEGSGSSGAVLIPGTPSGRDVTSIMQACVAGNTNGEWNGNDITALEFMYPAVTNTSPCDGVGQWQSGINYPVGARVVYFGNLFQRTSSGWNFIQAC